MQTVLLTILIIGYIGLLSIAIILAHEKHELMIKYEEEVMPNPLDKPTFDGIFEYFEEHASPGKMTYTLDEVLMETFDTNLHKWETLCIIDRDFNIKFPLINHEIEAAPVIEDCKNNKEGAEAILNIIKQTYGEKMATFRNFEDIIKDVAYINNMEIYS